MRCSRTKSKHIIYIHGFFFPVHYFFLLLLVVWKHSYSHRNDMPIVERAQLLLEEYILAVKFVGTTSTVQQSSTFKLVCYVFHFSFIRVLSSLYMNTNGNQLKGSYSVCVCSSIVFFPFALQMILFYSFISLFSLSDGRAAGRRPLGLFWTLCLARDQNKSIDQQQQQFGILESICTARNCLQDNCSTNAKEWRERQRRTE